MQKEDHDARCKIFLGYTSNLISSGLRETFRFLVEHKMVIKLKIPCLSNCFQIHCIVTTAGGVEEDFIKCLAPTYLGDFKLKGADLRSRGLNRIGKFANYALPVQ